MVVPKTDFIEVLEQIHANSDMRYGQIINNALQLKYGRSESGEAKYDVFNLRDETFTAVLKSFVKDAAITITTKAYILKYDSEADAAYMAFEDKKATEAVEVCCDVLVDLDSHKRIIGVEILNVRKTTKHIMKIIANAMKTQTAYEVCEDKSKKDPKGLLKLKPFDFGKGSENLSVEIDKVLYGVEKPKRRLKAKPRKMG